MIQLKSGWICLPIVAGAARLTIHYRLQDATLNYNIIIICVNKVIIESTTRLPYIIKTLVLFIHETANFDKRISKIVNRRASSTFCLIYCSLMTLVGHLKHLKPITKYNMDYCYQFWILYTSTIQINKMSKTI